MPVLHRPPAVRRTQSPRPAAGRSARRGRRFLPRCGRRNPLRCTRQPSGGVMRAAVVNTFGEPLVIENRPVPEPGPGQVLVRIEASGVCHTDIHAAHGDWPVKPNPPFVPGHEGVGPVERVGAGVPQDLVGKRVAIPWLATSCGNCRYCVSGRENLCESQQNSGYSVDGAYAEYAVAFAHGVVEVPDEVSSFDAAPLTCAGVTTYKAIKVAGVTPSERVAIFGVGGLGHLAVQYARLVGGLVTAVDIEKPKLDLAAELGADHLVNAAETDPVAEIQKVGGADVALVLAASPKVFEQAYRSLRRGGRLVMVALPADNASIDVPIFETVLGGISVIGSIVGTRQDLAEVFALHAAGRTRVVAEPRKLPDVNTAFTDVLAGRVPGRLVFRRGLPGGRCHGRFPGGPLPAIRRRALCPAAGRRPRSASGPDPDRDARAAPAPRPGPALGRSRCDGHQS